MGVLSKLKSLLGVGDETATRRGDVDVTVEREPTEGGVETGAATAGAGAASTRDGAAEAAAEPAAAGAETGDAAADSGAADEPAGGTAAAAEPPGDPVEKIKGVGPSYAGRLANVGVETVPELAEQDAESLADATGLSEKRIARWIEQAKARTR